MTPMKDVVEGKMDLSWNKREGINVERRKKRQKKKREQTAALEITFMPPSALCFTFLPVRYISGGKEFSTTKTLQ